MENVKKYCKFCPTFVIINFDDIQLKALITSYSFLIFYRLADWTEQVQKSPYSAANLVNNGFSATLGHHFLQY